MLESLESIAPWHWMLLGIVLLGLETLGIGGFLIGAGVAAFVTCLIALFDVDWSVQFTVFGFLSVFFTIIYWKRFRKFNEAREGNIQVNNKMAALIGKTGKVVMSNGTGAGKAQFGDTLWEIRCKQELNQGDEVSVTSYEGTTLLVSKLI